MIQEENHFYLTEEIWRDIFSGKNHRIISLTLAEGFSKLLKFCDSEELMVNPKEFIDEVSVFDVNDLSETTKLFTSRFETVFFTQHQRPKYLNITQCISSAVYTRSINDWKTNFHKAKVYMQKSTELENIARNLKYARNVNAHTNNEILDFGFSLMVFASVMRLFEIFDYKNIPQIDIDEISRKIKNEIYVISTRNKTATNQPHVSKEENENVIKTLESDIPSLDEIDLQSNVGVTEGIDEVKDERELDNLTFDQKITSSELEKQKLIKLRYEIYDYFDKINIEISDRYCFLDGSNLTDILLFRPQTAKDLKKVLSVQNIIRQNAKIAEIQLENFSQKIVEVF